MLVSVKLEFGYMPTLLYNRVLKTINKKRRSYENFAEPGRLYANCWSANYDDYALWKIYTKGSPYGICIESTIGKVLDSLLTNKSIFQLYHNPIDYTPNSVRNMNKLKSIVEGKSTDEIIEFLPFIKKLSYYYEQEYRFILYRKKNVHKDWINSSLKESVNVRCDILKLVVTMHFSPFMPVWFKKALRKYTDDLFNGNSVIRRKTMERLYHLGNIHDKSQIKETV